MPKKNTSCQLVTPPSPVDKREMSTNCPGLAACWRGQPWCNLERQGNCNNHTMQQLIRSGHHGWKSRLALHPSTGALTSNQIQFVCLLVRLESTFSTGCGCFIVPQSGMTERGEIVYSFASVVIWAQLSSWSHALDSVHFSMLFPGQGALCMRWRRTSTLHNWCVGLIPGWLFFSVSDSVVTLIQWFSVFILFMLTLSASSLYGNC